jgi:hypothetical protein
MLGCLVNKMEYPSGALNLDWIIYVNMIVTVKEPGVGKLPQPLHFVGFVTLTLLWRTKGW